MNFSKRKKAQGSMGPTRRLTSGPVERVFMFSLKPSQQAPGNITAKPGKNKNVSRSLTARPNCPDGRDTPIR